VYATTTSIVHSAAEETLVSSGATTGSREPRIGASNLHEPQGAGTAWAARSGRRSTLKLGFTREHRRNGPILVMRAVAEGTFTVLRPITKKEDNKTLLILRERTAPWAKVGQEIPGRSVHHNAMHPQLSIRKTREVAHDRGDHWVGIGVAQAPQQLV
jgi:hypothetical protein